MARNIDVIWVSGEAKNFSEKDWTGQIRLNWFDKLGFRRKGANW
jgi:hypothetical protein